MRPLCLDQLTGCSYQDKLSTPCQTSRHQEIRSRARKKPIFQSFRVGTEALKPPILFEIIVETSLIPKWWSTYLEDLPALHQENF